MCKLVQNLLVIVVLKKSKLKKYIDTKKKKNPIPLYLGIN
jgi:hypothetical protein